MDEIPRCDYSDNRHLVVIFSGTVCYAVELSSNFWVYGCNPMMWPNETSLPVFCTVSFVSQYFTRIYYFNHLREWKRYPITKAELKSPDVISDIFALYHLFLSILQQGIITLTTSGNERDTLILKQCSKSPDVISDILIGRQLWNLSGLQYREETRSAAALWSLKMRENKNKPLRARTVTKPRELRQRQRRTATRTAKRQTGWIKKKTLHVHHAVL